MVSGRHLGLAVSLLLLLACGVPETPPPAAKPSAWIGQAAPGLDGALTWLNSTELKLDALRGKVVVLHFFDYTSPESIRTYPYLLEWQRRYASLDVQIIGVHAPRYEFALDPVNVQASARHQHLAYPIAIDSYAKISEAYSNTVTPRLVIVDPRGQICFDQTGPGKWAEAEKQIQTFVRTLHARAKLPAVMLPVHDIDRPRAACYPATPELRLRRTGGLANPEAAGTNTTLKCRLPENRVEGRVYIEGDWSLHDEFIRHAADKDDLVDGVVVKYRGVDANVMMKPEQNYWMEVYVELNGQPVPKAMAGADISYNKDGQSLVRADSARLYNLTRQQPYGPYELRLSVRGKGLSVYALHFGTAAIPRDVAHFQSSKN